MGDVRFLRPLARLSAATRRLEALREAPTDDLIMALAAASPDKDPLFVNVLATELQNRARRALAVSESIVEAVCIIDKAGQVTHVNPAAERLVGRRAADLVGLPLTEAAPLVDAEGKAVPWEERPTSIALRDGVTAARDDLFLALPGRAPIAVAIRAAPIRADGEVVAAIASTRDVSAQRAAEADLRFHKMLLDAVGDAVIATRPDGTIIYWSRSAEALYGWPADDVLGRNVVDVSPMEASREDAEAIMEALRRGEPWSGVFPVRRADGSRFLARVSDAPVLDAAGRLVAIIGVSREA